MLYSFVITICMFLEWTSSLPIFYIMNLRIRSRNRRRWRCGCV